MNQTTPGITESYRGKVYGLLGLTLFRLGDFAQAGQYTELALNELQANR